MAETERIGHRSDRYTPVAALSPGRAGAAVDSGDALEQTLVALDEAGSVHLEARVKDDDAVPEALVEVGPLAEAGVPLGQRLESPAGGSGPRSA